MKWTGERLVTDMSLGSGVVDHLHRYALTLNFIKNKIVIDIACGEGYGSNLMSKYALKVTGVDISDEAVLHAAKKYKRNNLDFITGAADKIPLDDHSVDVVVSFETLEHHDKHKEMMIEVKRVLKKDGVFIISTPEKENYQKVDPNNIFHVKELNLHEFEELISENFQFLKVLHQKFINASVVYSKEGDFSYYDFFEGDFESVNNKSLANSHVYNIIIASDSVISHVSINQVSLFDASVVQNINLQAQLVTAEQKGLEIAKQSNSYKIGSLILLPIKILKKLF
jgi:ubiquinone/menaquinone biosynthesis C-methylase UbiE